MLSGLIEEPCTSNRSQRLQEPNTSDYSRAVLVKKAKCSEGLFAQLGTHFERKCAESYVMLSSTAVELMIVAKSPPTCSVKTTIIRHSAVTLLAVFFMFQAVEVI